MLIPILVSAFLALAFVADLYTTKRAIVDNPTRFHEANPIMAVPMRKFGFVGLAAVKLIVLGLIVWAVFAWREWAVYAPALIAAAITAYVAWRNKQLVAKVR